MKIVHAAIISTALVIMLGIVIVAPNFLRSYPDQRPKVMISISVIDPENVSAWSHDLAAFLRRTGNSATVFFVGKIAEMCPQSIRCFPHNVDVGSETYSNVNLTSLEQADLQLEEVDRGKFEVDYAGDLCSKLFKAPFGSANGDIFLLLRTCGITADFSYQDHYNICVNDQFIKYECSTYSGYEQSSDFLLSLPSADHPIILSFNNTVPVSSITGLVSQLQGSNVRFVSASQLSGLSLTER